MKFISSLNWEINVPDSLLIKTSWHLINRYHLWRAVDSSDRVFCIVSIWLGRKSGLCHSDMRFISQNYWQVSFLRQEALSCFYFGALSFFYFCTLSFFFFGTWSFFYFGALSFFYFGALSFFYCGALSFFYFGTLSVFYLVYHRHCIHVRSHYSIFVTSFSVYALDNTSGVYFTSITPLPGLQ